MQNYLQVNQLTKTYPTNGIIAIDHVDFTISQGEFACILGPSGCGKTTLLRTIAGLEQVTNGNVTLAGEIVTKPGPELGVVYQEHRLFPWLTVQDNVEYGLARNGTNKKERNRISQYYLELIGLEGFRKSYPKELSIGMSQRVGIARALATDPRILLMDEPFASVDAQTRQELQKELLRIWHETGKTILFVTHSIEEAITLGQRIIILSTRPSNVKQIIPVDIDYPRDTTTVEFNKIKRRIMDLLFD